MANFFGINIPIPQFSLPKISLPSLPKVSLPAPQKIEIPKITVPDVQRVIPKIITSPIPVVAVAGAVGESVAGAVAGGVPEIKLPTPPKVELPKISLPKFDLPKPAWSGAGTVPGRIITPEEAERTGIPGGVTVPAGSGGGNLIDTIINARDKSYSDSTEHIAAGNIAGGGAQFGATAAADVLLPMDLTDAANKWMTGRGDQIDGELALWAAIDAVSVLAVPFTFGASYAAARAAKAGKLAAKTAKVGGEMSKGTAISKGSSLLTEAGKASNATKAVTPSSYLKAYQQTAVKTTSQAQSAYAKQFARLRKQQQEIAAQIRKQQAKISKQMSELAAKFKAPTKSIGAAGDAAQVAGKTSRTATVLGKTGNALKYTGLGLGVGAIGLTALGALGGPAQAQEVPPEEPWIDDGYAPEPWWTMPDLPGGDIPWGDYQFPDGEGGYTDEYGNYPPGYPDFFGLEDYGQGLFGAAEEIPVAGGLFHEIRKRGLTVPVIVGVLVLVILFLRSKKGKKMIGDVKKKVGSATKGAKKAVGA